MKEAPTSSAMPIITARELHTFVNGGDKGVGIEEALDTKKASFTSEDQALFEDFVGKLGVAKADLDATAPTTSVLWAPDSATLCLMQSFLAEQLRNRPPADVASLAGRGSRSLVADNGEAQFDDGDVLAWAGSFFTWWRRAAKRPFRESPLDEARAIPMPDDTSLALFADWGVGPHYGAVIIKETIDDPRKIPDPLFAAIHLGDTYYSGTEDEVRGNLVANFPSQRAKVRRLTLNGNHEMYGGARGYYQALEEFGQPCSYFALQNKNFTVIALDTAYEDSRLAGQQVEWLKRILNQAGGARQIIFLSHHQPFSAFEPGGQELVAQLDPILNSGRVLAWYWGHEHRCVIYDRHSQWGTSGRCIGHGGYPYFRVNDAVKLRLGPAQSARSVAMTQLQKDDNSLWYAFPTNLESPAGIILGDDNRYLREEHARYGAQGLVLLELRGKQATERFLRPDGTQILSQALKP